MWTNKNRGRYDRSRLRYPSDLTDEEWALVEPLIAPAKRGGNRRHVVVREVVNGLMYILSTGCQWRAIAKDLPPRSTLYDYFDLWGWDGTLDRIHDALYAQCRQAASREASPTAAIIDSQSVKSAEKGGMRLIRRARCGQKDQGQEAPHPRRYAGLADARDRPRRRRPGPRRRRAADGELVRRLSVPDQALCRRRLPGTGVRKAVKRILARVNVEIVKRSDQATGFVALPKRWIVERTFAWLGRCRRLAKDWECLNHKALAFLRPRLHPPHVAKTMQSRMMFSDKILSLSVLAGVSSQLSGSAGPIAFRSPVPRP